MRAIRGATTVTKNEAEVILEATRELLVAILAANSTLKPIDLGAAWFTLTDDLDAVYPAQAARQLGWLDVPLMCAREIPVPGSLERCIRVMLFWNTSLSQQDIHHVYQREAIHLRPDLIKE